jgi:small subunit ribosomal protein S4
MGDPRKTRKKYTTPAHMWQGTRIADEFKLKKEFGLKNNTEIWRANAFVSNARQQVRKLIGKSDDKAEAQKKLLLGRLTRLGIVSKESKLADVLAINTRNVLDRRLQTILSAKGIAKSMKEARQMIVHGQVKYNGKKHTIPSTIVKVEEEASISYIGPSRAPRPPKKKETAKDSPSIEGEVKAEATEKKEEKPKEDKKE